MVIDQNGFTTEQMISICGATPVGLQDAIMRKLFCIDSRTISVESVFLPLKGENTDGHFYLLDALSSGCKVAFCSARYYSKNTAILLSVAQEHGAVILVVSDVLKALHSLAKAFLDSRKPEIRIGLTGSSGKTTTKEIIASMLNACGSVFVTEGNKNSEIGLPLSIFDMKDRPRFAIFEMGMDHRGEMFILSDIVRPDFALITNIGTAHLQKLGSVRAIAEQKRKIYGRFSGTQTALINEEEPWKDFLAKRINGRVFLYGLKSTAGIESAQNLGIDGWKIRWNGIDFDFPLPGDHNLKNLCAALSLCGMLQLDPQMAVRGLSRVTLPPGRLQIKRGKILLIEDCYNANPDSMRMGLNFFCSLQTTGRKVAVLGDMKELGKISRKEHIRIGKNVATCGLDQVFFFGELMKDAYEAYRKNRFALGQSEYSVDYQELEKQVGAFIKPGDSVYLKASRSMKLERLSADLLGKDSTGGTA